MNVMSRYQESFTTIDLLSKVKGQGHRGGLQGRNVELRSWYGDDFQQKSFQKSSPRLLTLLIDAENMN